MSYHITVDYRPEGKYPYAMNTEADQIPLTRAELESLRFEIDSVLMDSDTKYQQEISHECTF